MRQEAQKHKGGVTEKNTATAGISNNDVNVYGPAEN
jgi:hypothetical protein